MFGGQNVRQTMANHSNPKSEEYFTLRSVDDSGWQLKLSVRDCLGVPAE